MRFKRLLIDDQIGALSALATIDSGQFYGISANHVLSGSDGNLQTTDKVFGFDIDKSEWPEVGKGNVGFNHPGAEQKPENYGMFDVGIFKVGVALTGPLVPLPINQNIRNKQYEFLEGVHVFSYSVMDERVISGVISQVFSKSASGTAFDLTIEAIDGEFLTKKGDSGILWTDITGAAIGVHIYGINNPSQFSYCVLVDRICLKFGIKELWNQLK